MKLIIGLGNPGRAYANTRHNIGAKVVEALAKNSRVLLKRSFLRNCQEAKAIIEGKEIILAIPLTYMNLSGKAVSSLIKKYKIKPHDLLVVLDDLDLEFGRLKIRVSGSSAGHRGMASVIEVLGTQDFNRLRLGIGRPKAREDAAEFVLSKFNYAELKGLDAFITRALDCCRDWVAQGSVKCMEKYNNRERIE